MSDILDRPYKRLESSLRKSLTNKFKSLKFFVQNIESGSTGVGIPDMYVECATTNCWIEVKTTHNPKRAGTLIKPDWRPGQLAWAENYKAHRLKGKWFLVIQVGTEIYYSSVPRESYTRSELHPFENILRELL